MSDDALRELVALEGAASRARFLDVDRMLSKPQRRVLGGKGKRKILCAGRRSGKTYLEAWRLLCEAAQPPCVPVLYATQTRANAKEIIWDDLLALNEEYRLEFTARLQDLELRHPAGGKIQLRGVNNEREISKIRGKRFKFAVLDEAQAIPDRNLEKLLKGALGPTLIDWGAELWIAGSRSPVRAGLWWSMYAGKLASAREVHSWSVRQNDRLPAVLAGRSIDSILDEVRADFGWGHDDPTYRREYENEDVEDMQALLYPLTPENHYQEREPGRWHYVVGVDLGYDDADAIAVLGWRDGDPRVFLVEEHVSSQRTIHDLQVALVKLIERYKETGIERIVIDQGGLGKKIAETLRQRPPHIPLEPAEKQQKSEHIKLINADIRRGLILCRPDSIWAADCKLVQRDREAMISDRLQELPAKKGGYHSDICDAVLYAWRWTRGYLEERTAPTEVRAIDADPFEARIMAEAATPKEDEGWL